MKKSLYTDEHQAVVDLLRKLRAEAGVTQVELAKLLDQSQSFVSKYERGDRRLDVIQLRTVCRTLNTSLPEFAALLEKKLGGKKAKRGQRR